MRRLLELFTAPLQRARVARWERALDRRMVEQRSADVTRAFMRGAGQDPQF